MDYTARPDQAPVRQNPVPVGQAVIIHCCTKLAESSTLRAKWLSMPVSTMSFEEAFSQDLGVSLPYETASSLEPFSTRWIMASSPA